MMINLPFALFVHFLTYYCRLATICQTNAKVNIADTASMLTPYLRDMDTTAMLANYLTALNTKAPINNPTFTGTVSGISKTMVGLPDVDNTSDANKPVSTATQTALN